jgi:hypothetical protein
VTNNEVWKTAIDLAALGNHDSRRARYGLRITEHRPIIGGEMLLAVSTKGYDVLFVTSATESFLKSKPMRQHIVKSQYVRLQILRRKKGKRKSCSTYRVVVIASGSWSFLFDQLPSARESTLGIA